MIKEKLKCTLYGQIISRLNSNMKIWNEIFISSVYVALIFDNDGNPSTVGMALK